MNLYEFEGKRLLAQYGVAVPESKLVKAPGEPAPMAFPFVAKAQVRIGGRGKAGGVRVCADEAEFRKNANEIFGLDIRGHVVRALLCEETMRPEKEIYFCMTVQGVSTPTIIASASGGMEIEKVAAETPEKILRLPVDPFTGPKGYQKRLLARELGVDAAETAAFVDKLWTAFQTTQAELIEINPLGVVGGAFVAMDAKVILDDHSRPMAARMAELEAARKSLYGWTVPEKEATTITFVPLAGDIGLVADGAGVGMLSLDMIVDGGNKVASYAELGGITSAEVMYRALDLTFGNNADLSAVLIVLIGGFNRMDQMAEGIVGYLRDHPTKVPIYTRMCGTMEDIGKETMQNGGLPVFSVLTEAVNALPQGR